MRFDPDGSDSLKHAHDREAFDLQFECFAPHRHPKSMCVFCLARGHKKQVAVAFPVDLLKIGGRALRASPSFGKSPALLFVSDLAVSSALMCCLHRCMGSPLSCVRRCVAATVLRLVPQLFCRSDETCLCRCTPSDECLKCSAETTTCASAYWSSDACLKCCADPTTCASPPACASSDVPIRRHVPLKLRSSDECCSADV
jgi:hypothetical protein